MVLWYKLRVIMNLLATYVHNIDPVLWEVPGTSVAVRWYGLAYLAGFLLGYLLLKRLSARSLYCVPQDKLADFITAVCLFGVVCGGRLGEFFFYWLPQHGLSGFLEDPTWVFRVWEGGMASHGGILGVFAVALWYARKNACSLGGVLDGLAIAAPIGLFFGRVANFINGELYGRVCAPDSVFAVKFPQSVVELPVQARVELQLELFVREGVQVQHYDGLVTLCRENAACRDIVASAVEPRYPSQLFEAFGEGLLIFAVLLFVRLKWKNAPAGLLAGLFGVLYALARIVCECFKQPDDAVWAGITKGQGLSVLIFFIGLYFIFAALKQKNTRNFQKN